MAEDLRKVSAFRRRGAYPLHECDKVGSRRGHQAEGLRRPGFCSFLQTLQDAETAGDDAKARVAEVETQLAELKSKLQARAPRVTPCAERSSLLDTGSDQAAVRTQGNLSSPSTRCVGRRVARDV